MESNSLKRDLEQPTIDQPHKKTRNEDLMQNVDDKEFKVGISQFVTPTKGFTGILKQRFSDFMVYEIDPNGNVVHLTDINSIPIEDQFDKPNLNELVSKEKYEQFLEFLKKVEEDHKVEFIFDPEPDKDKRTLIHKAIKEYSHVDSKTKDSDVVVAIYKNPDNIKRGKGWPSGRGDYLKFVLYKENKDTSEVISLLSRFLKTRDKQFSISGTKDKRGITVQRVTVYRITAEAMRNLNPRLYGFKLGNFSYVKDQLRLGDHRGNHFEIVVRDVNAEDETINDALKAVRSSGFLNYYGLQRFGTGLVGTHEVGIAALQNNFEKAVNLILFSGSSKESQQIRDYYLSTKDISGTIAKLPKWMTIDRIILKSLQDSPNGFVNAFQKLPRILRMMYGHSFQSYIWNHMASERIKKYGIMPVKGDLIIEEDVEQTKQLDEEDEEGVNQGEEVVERVYTSSAKIKILSTEEAVSGKYNLGDIVLPLPGSEIVYPENDIGQMYKDMLSKHQISFSDIANFKMKDYYLTGGYRKLLENAMDVEWEILRYNDEKSPLTRSDLEALQDKPIPQSIPDGKFKAVRMKFSLPNSAYATMFFREIFKCSTSLEAQKNLTEAFMAKQTKEEETK